MELDRSILFCCYASPSLDYESIIYRRPRAWSELLDQIVLSWSWSDNARETGRPGVSQCYRCACASSTSAAAADTRRSGSSWLSRVCDDGRQLMTQRSPGKKVQRYAIILLLRESFGRSCQSIASGRVGPFLDRSSLNTCADRSRYTCY